VLSALMHRMTLARNIGQHELCLWGSGKPLREFVFVDDIAEACILLLSTSLSEIQLPINIGSGEECSIFSLAEQIAKVVGYHGKISWDENRPDGAPRKLLDSSRILDLGWKPRTSLEKGLKLTYQWYSK
jgi:GDP-L-fucose synthase